MNCEKIQESLEEYYLGELDGELSARFDAHLAEGCSNCREALSDVVAGIDLLYDLAPTASLNDALRGDILDRVRTNSSQSGLSEPFAPSLVSPSPTVATHVVAFASIGAVAAGFILAMLLFPSKLPQDTRTAGQRIDGRPGFQSHAGELSGPDRVPPTLRMADDEFRMTSFVSLRPPAKADGPHGTVIWDPLAGEVHFFGFGCRGGLVDTQYVLWVEDSTNGNVESIPLDVDNKGRCQAVMSASTDFPPQVFVTIESLDGSNREQLLIREL